MTLQAPAQDFEHEVEVVDIAGAVDHGESAQAECRGDVAVVIPMSARPLDGDDGGRDIKAGEEFEEAGAGFFGGGLVIALVEGEAQVDDGDVDAGGVENGRGFAAGACSVRDNAHGLEEAWEVVDPGAGFPTGVGEEEVEAAGG